MSDSRTGIVVLNWNGLALTRDCINSLLLLSGPRPTLYVVDNGSTDGSSAALYREFGDKIVLIANQRNLLYAGGNNVGILRALADGCERVLLLNNDTKADTELLTELDRAVDDRGDGVYCPKIFYFQPPDRIWYAGGALSLRRARWSHRGIRETDRGQYDQFGVTHWATGCALYATRKVFDTIGLLDDNFQLYQEDVDFSLRGRDAGFTIWYVPKAVVWHKVSASIGGNLSRAKLQRKWRSQVQLMRKHVRNPVVRFIALADFVVTEVIRVVWNGIRGRLR